VPRRADGRKTTALRWLGATMLLGIVVRGAAPCENGCLLGDGWRPVSESLGAPPSSAHVFSVTGLHLLHVVAGVIVIAVIALGYRRGAFEPDTWRRGVCTGTRRSGVDVRLPADLLDEYALRDAG